MYETILVATDGSESAARATDHALDLASTFDADFPRDLRRRHSSVREIDAGGYGGRYYTNLKSAVRTS